MPISDCYFFKNSYEFFPVADIDKIPIRVRGIYVLYRFENDKKMNVVYIGMARGEKSGVKGRLKVHKEK